MKPTKRRSLFLILSLLVWQGAKADLKADFKSLGGNEKLIDLSDKINPSLKSRVVQKRMIPRENRFEFFTQVGQRFGGDSFLTTQFFGVGVQYHFNPRFSAGVLYQDFANDLTAQGKRAFDQGRQGFQSGAVTAFPEIDPPRYLVAAQAYFYPVYGKLNFFNQSVVQFDWHVNASVGQSYTFNTDSPYFGVGTGLGIWMNRYLVLRFDFRWEHYQDFDSIYQERRQLQPASLMLGLGVWL